VLDVRRKGVIVCIESVGLAPGRFSRFLAQPDKLLESLRSPARSSSSVARSVGCASVREYT